MHITMDQTNQQTRNNRCSPLVTHQLLEEGFGSGDGCSAVMLIILCIVSALVGAVIGYMVHKNHVIAV